MRRSYHWLGSLAFFALLGVLHTWPLARLAGTHMQSGADPKTMIWGLYDLARNLLRDPTHLMDGSAFYPYGGTIAAADHQLTGAILGAPMLAAGAPMVLLFNTMILASFALSGWFTYLLVRRLSGSSAAGLVAGSLFAFSCARIYNLPHAHILATQWIPLALLAVHSYLDRPTVWRWLGLSGAGLAVALASWQIAMIGGVTLSIVVAWTLVGAGSLPRRTVAGLLALAVLGAIAILPLARAYSDLGAQWPPAVAAGGVQLDSVVRNSVDVVRLAAMPVDSRAPYAPALARRGPSAFPGIVAMVLMVPALLLLFRNRARERTRSAAVRRLALGASGALVMVVSLAALTGLPGIVGWLRPIAPFALLGLVVGAVGLTFVRRVGPQRPELILLATYAAVAAAGVLFALGPRVMVSSVDVGSGLWRLDLLPIPLLMRAPVRFALLLALGGAVLAGLGLHVLLDRIPHRFRLAATVASLALINLDLAFAMPEFASVPARTGVDRWLAESPEQGAVIEFPLNGNYWAIYASQEFYDRRNVDGRGYLRPAEVRRMRTLPDLSPLQVEMLWEHSHPRFVVVRSALYTPRERQRVAAAIERLGGALQPMAADGDDAVYELFDRGRGAQLRRHWPRASLGDGGGSLQIVARLTDGSPETRGELTVHLNDKLLRTISEAELRLRPEQSISFDPEDLVFGINTFELAAGYRLRSGVARPIGSSGVEVAADIEVTVESARRVISVNGVALDTETGGVAPAASLVRLDPLTGTAVERLDAAGTDAARRMIDFLGRVDDGQPVAIASYGVTAVLQEPAVQDALRSVGLVAAGAPTDSAYAAVGIGGARPGSGLEQWGAVGAAVSVGTAERRRVQLRSLTLR